MKPIKEKLCLKICELEGAQQVNIKENKDFRNEIELLNEQIE